MTYQDFILIGGADESHTIYSVLVQAHIVTCIIFWFIYIITHHLYIHMCTYRFACVCRSIHMWLNIAISLSIEIDIYHTYTSSLVHIHMYNHNYACAHIHNHDKSATYITRVGFGGLEGRSSLPHYQGVCWRFLWSVEESSHWLLPMIFLK